MPGRLRDPEWLVKLSNSGALFPPHVKFAVISFYHDGETRAAFVFP